MSIDPKVFRQVRKALGLTQEELADAIGLSRVTVNKMERGRLRRGIPDEIAERLMALKPRTQTVEKAKQELQRFRDKHPDVVRAWKDAEQAAYVKGDADLWDNEEEDEL